MEIKSETRRRSMLGGMNFIAQEAGLGHCMEPGVYRKLYTASTRKASAIRNAASHIAMSHNKLYELSGENLSICLRDRLHGLPSFGPPFSELGGEAAYDWLVAEYAAYREVSFRRVIFEILREFLQELPSPSLWPPHRAR